MRKLFLAIMLFAIAATAHAQTAPYTFHTATQTVVTDVTVADRAGHPVHGLKSTDFHLFDDNHPQALTAFEEHTAAEAEPSSTLQSKPGVYSNRYLQHLPPVLNVILLDLDNLEIPEQGYLAYELSQFLDQAPSEQPLAIYTRRGDAAVLLQPFTTDRALLHATVASAIPRFPPTGREYYFDLDTLHEIASALTQIPGRKNVLWFSGGSTLLRSQLSSIRNEDLQARAFRRKVYDELAANRIAIYPIDARGLIGTGRDVNEAKLPYQHMIMDDIASDTGGRAFYSTNDLSGLATGLVASGADFYTLAYTPRDFHPDHRWHTIRIEATGNTCCLTYRRGYFAGGPDPAQPRTPEPTHTLDGAAIEQPNPRSLPIVFEARIEPALSGAPKRGTQPYTIHYTIPAGILGTQTIDHKERMVLGVAIVAHNKDGRLTTEHIRQLTLTPNPAGPSQATPPMTFDQQIDLRRGDNFLRLTLWDITSGHLGSLEIPVSVAR